MSDSQAVIANLDGTALGSFWLALLSVALRLYCRKQSGGKLWWDDWMMVFATLWIIATHLSYMISLRVYLGRHLDTLELGAFVPFLRTVWIQSLLYIIDIALIKFSIILFYWRIFAVTARKSIITLAVVILVWAVVSLFITIFQCNPVPFFWERVPPGTCMDPRKIVIGVGCPNILTDFALTILPLPHVFRLKLRIGQRLLLGLIFMLGFFVVIVSIFRLVVFSQTPLLDPDVTWNLADGFKWTIVELMTSLLCANLPAMRPLVTVIRKAMPGRISMLFSSGKFGGSSRSNHKSPQVSFGPYQQPSIHRDPNKSFAQYHNPRNMGNPLELTNMQPSPPESQHELNRKSRESSRDVMDDYGGNDGTGTSQPAADSRQDLESGREHTTREVLGRPEPTHANAINVKTTYTVHYEN